MKIVGIDPGLTGAIAIIEDHMLMAVYDMPVLNKRAQATPLIRILSKEHPDVVVVEDLHAMPRGSIASFSLGYTLGIIIASVTGLSQPLVRMRPSEWKKIQGLIGKDKNASRLLATERWPSFCDSFRRVKDDGRAEAALIADAYRKKENGHAE